MDSNASWCSGSAQGVFKRKPEQLVRFPLLRGFGTVTAALLCRQEQWDVLRSTGYAFLSSVLCISQHSAALLANTMLGAYEIKTEDIFNAFTVMIVILSVS